MSLFLDLLEFESEDLERQFRKASLEGSGTPQEVADRREAALKEMLEKYFPFPFRIAKGNISDSDNNRSASIDCLVLNPEHPYTISANQNFSLILAEGVDFAIEVKPDLSKESEVTRSLNQISSVKKLTKKRVGTIDFGKKNTVKMKETLTKIPSFIFGNKTYSNIETLCEKIVSHYEEKQLARIYQFDAIIVNGEGILFNSRKDSYFHLSGKYEGLYFVPFEHKTLAAFLLQMNTLPLSSPRMSSSVLSHYNTLPSLNMTTFSGLNARLLELG
ncbi:DUF6602 domain-containing protein [Photobacterium leiognathi]|uniref:DUF6602 domain-containing protein n=1 Tax=Photobacterium leiognathi TaxID=553611 RepID=UPI000D17A745|nr:DUF6602 domain-containing protein [Photobacterium leiognathi]PSW57867.1 hypothetical protein C0W50_07195 [Photobacterium leiognathi subsp. mandapamensis]